MPMYSVMVSSVQRLWGGKRVKDLPGMTPVHATIVGTMQSMDNNNAALGVICTSMILGMLLSASSGTKVRFKSSRVNEV